MEDDDKLSALQCALCALSYYRRRHVWKEKGSRRGALVRGHRIKDLSRSAEAVSECRYWLRRARAAGFRGSIRRQVMEYNQQEHGTNG